MKKLKIEGFALNPNLLTKIDQVTYDRIGYEDCDYLDIVKPDNFTYDYVISFYKDCELVGMITSPEKDMESNIITYIQKYYKD